MWSIFSYLLPALSILNFQTPFFANYVKLPPLPPPTGPLATNNQLSGAVYLAHHNLTGPETLAFSTDGELYAGLANGQIVRIDSDTGSVYSIVRIGTENDDLVCNDFSKGTKASCGRPMGLRFKPGTKTLYVADAFNGLYKVDVEKGTKTQVLSSVDARFGDEPMKITNDLAFGPDGTIYFIDSSYKYTINEAVHDILETKALGRLFSYKEESNELLELADGFYFPNGIEITPTGDSLLINECSTATITKYYLSGEKKGTKEFWLGLPGHSDTIRLTPNNTLLVPMAISRYGISPLDLIGEYPRLRTLFGIIFDFGKVFPLVPAYGLLIEYDLNGNPLRSWHDPSGKNIMGISCAIQRDTKLYLGTLFLDYIGVVDY